MHRAHGLAGMARWLLALALAASAAHVLAVLPRLRCPGDKPQCRDKSGYGGLDEHEYLIDGVQLLLRYSDGGHYVLECSNNLTLDNTALPRFESTLRVNLVQLVNCPLPRGSYADVCDRLNVRALDRLKLQLVGGGELAAEHLAGLARLRVLELSNARLAPGALAGLARLQHLTLDNDTLPRTELANLPRELQSLLLVRMRTNLTRDVLEPLTRLVNLTVRDGSHVSVALTPSLQRLSLDVRGALVPPALSPSLRSLHVIDWAARAPAAWSSCAALHTLDVRHVAAEALPARWASACAELRELRVERGPRLRALHATSLHGACKLRRLTLAKCALSALPEGLLDDAPNLSELDLSENRLFQLPNGLFAVMQRSLRSLDLSHNRLTRDVYDSLSWLSVLSVLNLSFNDLKDSCGGATNTLIGSSPLQNLKELTELNLKRTNTSLICRDWREAMPKLNKLNLSDNNFTYLTYWELQFLGDVPVKVDLTGNRVRSLRYERADYRLAVDVTAPASRAKVTLGAALACDCDDYWAARALRERLAHLASLQGAECASGRELGQVPLDELVCAAPALCGAAPACACATRSGDGEAGGREGGEGARRVLRVSCARAGVSRVADVLAPLMSTVPDDYEWQLILANNRIAELDAADFPKRLSVLDLTNNSLSALSPHAARALLQPARRVRLAGNPLACDCRAAVLQELRAALPDYGELACVGGERLARARLQPCAALGAGAVAALAALLALGGAAAGAALLRLPALRLRLKAALRLPASEPPARYDVFVSFSHGDERFVRELLAQLEAGPAPYRVCVHFRDWAPGGWIPAQIAASVRASRRTVAVVSEHFLRSAWAQAEFREAHALALHERAPRLVVVLLAPPHELPLDARLRDYLATNTYVQWGDPYFWHKLRLALPRVSRPAPAPAPEPAPTPAPAPAPATAPAPTPMTESSPLNTAPSSARSAPHSSPELTTLRGASCGAPTGREEGASIVPA